jgi:RNA polymerase sigma-70 factor (ECF subfamily)
VSDELEAREAVREAYSAYYRRLVAALYGMTGDYAEAQDVVQEAYARALSRAKTFLDVADPEAWLRTVAVNIARTRWRRRKLFDTLVRTGRVVRAPESVPGADPNRVALVAALQQLSRPTREAIVLHHLADMSVYEVAEALGVPVGTVKARLSRGRTILAKLLSELADEPARPAAAPTPGGRRLPTQPAAPTQPADEPPFAHERPQVLSEPTYRVLPAQPEPADPLPARREWRDG